MLRVANNTPFSGLKDHLKEMMLLGHENYPKNRENLVGLLNFWKGPAKGKNTTKAIHQ